MVMGLLEVHQHMQHVKAAVGQNHLVTTAPGGEPITYKIAFPNAGGPRNFPVKGCQERAATQTVMRVRQEHRDHNRGGKPPPPTVPMV